VDFRDADTEAAILGASPIHGALLVISATDSIVAGHQASLTRARQFGIPIIAVALTKCDAVEDVELLDLVTMEIRELLNKYGMPGDSFPIVQTRHFGTRPAEGRRHDREPEARQGIPALLDMLGG
jgi:elongation factor Tu